MVTCFFMRTLLEEVVAVNALTLISGLFFAELLVFLLQKDLELVDGSCYMLPLGASAFR